MIVPNEVLFVVLILGIGVSLTWELMCLYWLKNWLEKHFS